MSKKLLIIAGVTILGLTACSEKVQSIGYYSKHVDEAKKYQINCKLTDASQLKNPSPHIQNCMNATAGISLAWFNGSTVTKPSHYGDNDITKLGY